MSSHLAPAALHSGGLFVCGRCGADHYPRWREECDGCGRLYTLVRVPLSRRGDPYGSPAYRPQPRFRPPTRTLKEFAEKALPTQRRHWGFDALFLPLETIVTVDGGAGCGKSTLSALMALGLARAGVAVLVLSVEEGLDQTAVERWARCAALMNMSILPEIATIADVSTPEEARAEVDAWRQQHAVGVIVIDSVTELQCSAEFLARLAGEPGVGLILIQHLSTSGKPRGGWETTYKADVRISCKDLVASTTKNRWGPCASFPILEPHAVKATPAGVVLPFERPPLARP